MKKLPFTDAAPVVRTDFTDDVVWEAICDQIREPSDEGFEAQVQFIDDRAFDGISKDILLSTVPADYPHPFIIMVDARAIREDDHPLLIVNLEDGLGSARGDAFRGVPTEIHGIENNLSIANMDFADFAGATDSDGVFRGF